MCNVLLLVMASFCPRVVTVIPTSSSLLHARGESWRAIAAEHKETMNNSPEAKNVLISLSIATAPFYSFNALRANESSSDQVCVCVCVWEREREREKEWIRSLFSPVQVVSKRTNRPGLGRGRGRGRGRGLFRGGMMMGFNPYMGGYFVPQVPYRGRGRGYRWV